jgi:hypothetical protein
VSRCAIQNQTLAAGSLRPTLAKKPQGWGTPIFVVLAKIKIFLFSQVAFDVYIDDRSSLLLDKHAYCS